MKKIFCVFCLMTSLACFGQSSEKLQKMYNQYVQSQTEYNRKIVPYEEWENWYISSQKGTTQEAESKTYPSPEIQIQFGFGVDFLLNQEFPGTSEYSQLYDSKDYGYTTIRSDREISIMKMAQPNSGMNIPLFLKIDINKLHIIPSISLPIFNFTSSMVYITSLSQSPPTELRTHRGPEGDRGWNYGSNISAGSYSWGNALLHTFRIGSYVSYTLNGGVYANFEVGIGFFRGIRKYQIDREAYTVYGSYHYDRIDYSTSEYVYYYQIDDYFSPVTNKFINYNWEERELDIDIDRITIKSTEIPIYISWGGEHARIKVEYVFSENDNYGILGCEFIF